LTYCQPVKVVGVITFQVVEKAAASTWAVVISTRIAFSCEVQMACESVRSHLDVITVERDALTWLLQWTAKAFVFAFAFVFTFVFYFPLVPPQQIMMIRAFGKQGQQGEDKQQFLEDEQHFRGFSLYFMRR
jgi:hypothetical protein